MPTTVSTAAQHLGVDPSRVRQLLRAGHLAGRKEAGRWVVDDAAVRTAVTRTRPPGRPLVPARAWGLLAVLEGRTPVWLDPPSRSKVKRAAGMLSGAGPDRWRAALRARSLVVRCWAPDRALEELDTAAGQLVLTAAAHGAGPGSVEVYADVDAWMWLQPRVLMDGEVRRAPNLLVRVPQAVWPVVDGQVPALARAADQLDHPDPAVAADACARLRVAAGRVRT